MWEPLGHFTFKGDPPHPFLVASPRAETAARIAGDRGPVGSPRRA
jgi:hypothetical protein